MITNLRTLALDGIDMLVSWNGAKIQVRDPRHGRLISESTEAFDTVDNLVVCPAGWRDPLIAVTTGDGLAWVEPRTGQPAYLTDRFAYAGPMTAWAGTLLAGSFLAPYRVLRWDAGTGTRLEPLGRHDEQLTAVTVADVPGTGPVVCSADKSGTIRCWYPRTGAAAGPPLVTGDDVVMEMTPVELPDGRVLIAAASADLYRWDAVTGEPLGVPLVIDSYAVGSLDAAIVNGRAELITSGSDEVVQRWDAETGERVGDPVPGRCAAVLHRYGQLTLAIGTLDGTVDLRPLGQPHPDRRT